MRSVIILSANSRLKEVWEDGLKSEYRLFFFSHFDEMMRFIGDGMDALYIFHLESATEENIQKLLLFKRAFVHAVLVVSGVPNYDEGKSFIAAGANGYANANMHTEVLKQALHSIDAGGVWLSLNFVKELVSRIDKKSVDEGALKELSEREREVALLVSQGLHNHEIAAACGISERTVKAHLGSIFSKLGIHDRVALALYIKGVF